MITTKIEGMEALLRRVDTVIDELPEAVTLGLLEAGDAATLAMEERIDAAITGTGLERHEYTGLNPGRVETGQMIGSLRQGDGTAGTIRFTGAGALRMDIGYIHNAPEYTMEQENEEYSISGQLMALQRAYDVLATDTRAYVKGHVDDLVKQSLGGSYHPRPVSFSPRRTT